MNLKQLEKKERYLMKRKAITEAKQEALAEMKEIINRGLAKQMELVMLLVLHDKDGYGAERCADRIVAFEEMWGDINDQRLSLDDIEETIKEELGLIIEDDGIYKIKKDGSRKRLYPKEGE